MKFNCKLCNIEIIDKPSANRKYCSQKCHNLAFKGVSRPDWVGEKIRLAKKGKPNGLLGKKLSEETKQKIREARALQAPPVPKGFKYPNAITPRIHILRMTKEYKDWRNEILKRDNYTCQFCGIRGGELHVDHIKPFAHYPELRFNMGNGRTLCISCHRNTPTWGAIRGIKLQTI